MSDQRPSDDLAPVGPLRKSVTDSYDPRAEEEGEQFRGGKSRPTPTDRLQGALQGHITALDDRIASLEVDKQHLNERAAELLRSNRELQSDLDRLRPEIAELRQARRVAGTLGTFTTIIMFVGSCLISHAGTLADGDVKNWYRALGWASSGFGVLFTILILGFGWPPRKRDADQS